MAKDLDQLFLNNNSNSKPQVFTGGRTELVGIAIQISQWRHFSTMSLGEGNENMVHVSCHVAITQRSRTDRQS